MMMIGKSLIAESLMSFSLFLLQCPAYLALVVCKIGGKWSYSYCFVECCFQDLFKTVNSILV